MKKIFTQSVLALSMLAFGTASANAQAQVLEIDKNTKSVPTSASDTYDRITMERSVPTNRWTMMVFPANLDGFYFGIETERYLVTGSEKRADGVLVLDVVNMAERDDFKSGQKYLIKPVYGTEKITFVAPGMLTKVNKESGTLSCEDATGWVNHATAISDAEISELMNAEAYDIAGRKVSTSEIMSKGGMMIVNGKKVIIRK